MTDRQFLKRMIALTNKLTDAVEHDGYRSDAYNNALNEIYECGSRYDRIQRRRSMFAAAIIAFLLILLALYVGYILW